MTAQEQLEILQNFVKKISNQKDIPPEFRLSNEELFNTLNYCEENKMTDDIRAMNVKSVLVNLIFYK